MNARLIYEIVKDDCKGMDAIYEDYIIHLVGIHGLELLQKHKLIESCGVLGGRRLWVLCDRGDK